MNSSVKCTCVVCTSTHVGLYTSSVGSSGRSRTGLHAYFDRTGQCHASYTIAERTMSHAHTALSCSFL